MFNHIKKEVIMPYRDGTGPMGEGPMTGRKQGNCADDNVRNFGGRGFGRGFGRGRGFGFGFGQGRGFGWRWSDENRNPDEESSLKTGIDFLKNQLKVLEDRLNNLRHKD